MRRSSKGCLSPARAKPDALTGLTEAEVTEAVRVLEPFVTETRRSRLRGVLGQRLDSVTVVMDAPHDPHNGAAVLRSCDAFGIQRLHVVERREGFLAANSVARGSERWVDVVGHSTIASVAERLERERFALVATHPEGDLLPEDLRALPRVALVLGNERFGIANELAARCKHTVRIPMRGFAESLNVSVTAAILLDQATRGRPGDLEEAEQDRLYLRALWLTLPHPAEILETHGVAPFAVAS